MKSPLVSAAAVLICCGILAVAGIFGYSRYKAAQAQDSAFRLQLEKTKPDTIPTHMPLEMSQAVNPGELAPAQPAKKQ
jgi:hypothetical protein